MLQELIDLYNGSQNEKIQALLYRAARLAFEDSFYKKPISEPPVTLTPCEIRIGTEGNKIQCVKQIRSRLGYGLKEAKELAEQEFDRLGLTFGQFYQ